MKLFEFAGQRIRELRSTHGGGLSQERLAHDLGVTTNTISRWETATYRPDLEDLDKLARFFGVSVMEFFPPEARADSKQSEGMTALLRAAKDLDEHDLDELRRYAEFRRARRLVGPRPRSPRAKK